MKAIIDLLVEKIVLSYMTKEENNEDVVNEILYFFLRIGFYLFILGFSLGYLL